MPDVSIIAAVNGPVGPGVFVGDESGIDCSIVGASLSAQIWGGINRLVAQLAGSKALGPMNPRIYTMARAGLSASGFRDVTTGSNNFGNVAGFSAGPGYDQTTGWGGVDIGTFAEKFLGTTPSWANVPGLALDVGVRANETVWVIGTDGGTYRLSNTSFQAVGGRGVRIAVDPKGNAWVVTSTGNIYRFNGTAFVQEPGLAQDVGVGADGSVWVIGTDGGIYRFNGSSFQPEPGLGAQISVDAVGEPWVVSAQGGIYRGSGF